MADTADGTQFSDLPSRLAIEILVRLPVKALLICRYVRKDWMQLYFSDPYFIRRQLQTSNIQFLSRKLTKEGKFQFGYFVDEVSTENPQIETFEHSCEFLPDPEHEWRVVNSCNGLVCLVDKKGVRHASSIYVCNPILGEGVSIHLGNRIECFGPSCALGFSARHNQYKILLCIRVDVRRYEWKIYTLGGTRHWRSIETEGTIEPWHHGGPDFNTFIHGSIHWAWYKRPEGVLVSQSFNFETERFSLLLSPVPELDIGSGCVLSIGDVIAYNPSFVSLRDVGRGEEVIRSLRHPRLIAAKEDQEESVDSKERKRKKEGKISMTGSRRLA